MADDPNPDAGKPKDDAKGGSTPPWGDDFDPQRAWDLIERLRREVADEKTNTATERTAREAAETRATAAEQAAAQQDPEGKIAAAEERATKAERALAVSEVLVDFPGLKGFEDLLTGDTAEALKAQAERLSSLGKPADAGKPDGEQPPAGRTPEPDLTPGHGGDAPAPFDPVAIAKSARR